jgi:hypothetical protein
VAGAGGSGTILLAATGSYSLADDIAVAAGETLRIVAANGAFPTVDLGDGIAVACGEGAAFELNGLRMAGGTIAVAGDAEEVRLLDSTLVPGQRLDRLGNPANPGAISLSIAAQAARLACERSIMGAVEIASDVRAGFVDCIIDAGEPANPALFRAAGGERDAISLDRCTVVGRVAVTSFDCTDDEGKDESDGCASSDTIFFAEAAGASPPVSADRRQIGCLRFSYVPEGSRTPRRYRCTASPPPRFVARRPADPAYLQLSRTAPAAIARGAENGGEMGVRNRRFHVARADNLRRTAEEFMRVGMEAGAFYES